MRYEIEELKELGKGCVGTHTYLQLRRLSLYTKKDVKEYFDIDEKGVFHKDYYIRTFGEACRDLIRQWLGCKPYKEPRKDIKKVLKQIRWYETRIKNLKKEYGID